MPSPNSVTPDFNAWGQVPTQEFLDMMDERRDELSEPSSHPSLDELLWQNKPPSPMEGGAKNKEHT